MIIQSHLFCVFLLPLCISPLASIYSIPLCVFISPDSIYIFIRPDEQKNEPNNNYRALDLK